MRLSDTAVVVQFLKKSVMSVSFCCYQRTDINFGGVFTRLTGYSLLISRVCGKTKLPYQATHPGYLGVDSPTCRHPSRGSSLHKWDIPASMRPFSDPQFGFPSPFLTSKA